MSEARRPSASSTALSLGERGHTSPVGEDRARLQRSGALAKLAENARHQITTVE